MCAVGLRATIEGLCAEHGVTGGIVEVTLRDGAVKKEKKTNLMGKISGLCENGILT